MKTKTIKITNKKLIGLGQDLDNLNHIFAQITEDMGRAKRKFWRLVYEKHPEFRGSPGSYNSVTEELTLKIEDNADEKA